MSKHSSIDRSDFEDLGTVISLGKKIFSYAFIKHIKSRRDLLEHIVINPECQQLMKEDIESMNFGLGVQYDKER